MQTPPLNSVHEQIGASFIEEAGWLMPAYYTDSAQEYAAALHGVGLVDLSHFGKVRFAGKDGPDLLNRLSTNETLNLAQGSFTTTVLTSSKGRIVAYLTVLTVAENEMLLLCGPGQAKEVIEHIDKFLFGEELKMEDVTDRYALLHCLGPEVGRIGQALVNQASLPSESGKVMSINTGESHALMFSGPSIAGGISLYLLCENSASPVLWAKATTASASPIGLTTYEILRVQAGIPCYRKELTEDYNPWEARLDRAIDLHKGCYVGQEVIARLNTYDKVSKLLMGLEFRQGAMPQTGDKLSSAGDDAGIVTSVVQKPDGGKIGLGYVKVKHGKLGASLEIGNGKEAWATVVELPIDH